MGFDLSMRIALWGNSVAFGSAAFIFLFALWRRWRRHHETAVREAVEDRWKPLLFRRIAGESTPLPRLEGHQDWIAFTRMWNYYRNSLRGTPEERLNSLADEVGLREAARKMVNGRNIEARMVGVSSLGHLKDIASVPLLLGLLWHRHIALSLYAAKALAEIDPQNMARILLNSALERDDWPLAQGATILNLLSQDIICVELASRVNNCPPEQLKKLLKILRAVNCAQANDIAQRLLAQQEDVDIVISALNLLTDYKSLSNIYALLLHENWAVRVQAVTALGRILPPRHIDFLLPMLSDENWWVRYRTAQALANILRGDMERFFELRKDLENPFSIDIMNQVVSELTVK